MAVRSEHPPCWTLPDSCGEPQLKAAFEHAKRTVWSTYFALLDEAADNRPTNRQYSSVVSVGTEYVSPVRLSNERRPEPLSRF